jgi:type I restriction enzyme R subunit
MAISKEATARIKINKMLEESGWRFEADKNGKANIHLEPGVKYSELGDDFENEKHGFIDFLLLDKDGRALVVLEAKRESIDPLSAKEQARNYARGKGARFIILSNGNIHYLWDTKSGNPDMITKFPTQDSISQYANYIPNPNELAETYVDENYIIETQTPNYAKDPLFQDESTRPEFMKLYGLKQLRPYQLNAVKALQGSAKLNNKRFLFEMATGTGKTLISAAVIKLFLKSGNARRVLFLVDRLELEKQAQEAFDNYLGKDYSSMIYKDNRDNWQNASIVVSTIQSFMAGDRYKKEFSPTDFELVISDEAHRSIGGNSRVVFEYFVGYKLGLTATPKDYLKGFDSDGANTQREFERRQLLDTYKTFGCEPGEPTYSYDLLSGVKEGFLINPIIVDARTEITTQLLSTDGFDVHITTKEGETIEDVFNEKHYEKRFFNHKTNWAMCKAFIDNALMDPIGTGLGMPLFGKSIVFCVTQKHAARITNILNKLAMEKWPNYYPNSDFALQVSSQVQNAQQMTKDFANNCLSGTSKHIDGYKTSKARVAVTVGMMTTGYDCEDLLNIALMRPVFSPTDFVQIKGRGTRINQFVFEDYINKEKITIAKERYKLFDFFATCEYFENKFQYDEKIFLPSTDDGKHEPKPTDGKIEKDYKGPVDIDTSDYVVSLVETPVGFEGLRIDREGFKKAIEEDVMGNEKLKNLWENGAIEEAEELAKKEIFDKPKHFLNLEKIRKMFGVDRRINVKEFLEVAFGDRETFEMKDELLESEWEKFMEINQVDQKKYAVVKMFFKAYSTDPKVREIIKSRHFGRFNTESSFHFEEFQELNGYKTIVPQYINDYVYHLTNL